VPVDVVIRLRAGAGLREAEELLAVLAARPGFTGGSVGRGVDADDPAGPGPAVLVRFADLGSWRRALGAAPVKLVATPLLGVHAESVDAYEVVAEAGPGPEALRPGGS
jgi:hypothetical protein